VLNNNQLIWSDNFIFLFSAIGPCFSIEKGKNIRNKVLVVVSNIVLGVVVCGPLQGKIIAHRPFTMLPFYIQDIICVIINIADIQFT